ncbi:MAG: TatD family hydrolase [Victivallales bacterium]|nr:TatD family hydrolase [Victivallales bacterium]
MKVTDCHAHLADARIWEARVSWMADCRRNGLVGALANAAQFDEWPRVMQLAQEAPEIQPALGIHPFWPEQWTAEAKAQLEQHLKANEITAVGEIGLDFWNGRENQALQERAFAEQLQLAVQYGLPACIHNRKSWQEFFGILKELRINELCGYCHNFTGSKETAKQILDRGLHISFCSPVTYPEAERLRRVSAYVPAERLLVETDAPDLPQIPYRGAFSYPWQTVGVVKALAKTRRIALEALAEQIFNNYITLFSTSFQKR